jgi:predicted enzyme related to lactoylglutathione lyase
MIRLRCTGLAWVTALALAATLTLIPGTALPASSSALPPLVSPSGNAHIPGKFIWFTLASSDARAARRFYGRVFDWSFEPLRGSPEQYVVIRNEGKPIGALFRPVNSPSDRSAGRWLSFASVSNLEAALQRLTSTGHGVLVPATKLDGLGAHAVLRDPQGAIFGLLQSASGDPPDDPVPPGNFFWVDLYTRDVQAASQTYASLGLDVSQDTVSGDDRILLAASGHARAGIMKLPDDSREPGLLPYVQVDDVPTTLARVRAAGGTVLREPDPSVLEGQLAVFADPQGGVLGILSWPSTEDASGGAP